jgi:hypothetical protein
MRIASDGKVGIGTNNPSDALTVNGFTKLGTSVTAGSAVAIKTTEFSGTTGSGSSTEIAFTNSTQKVLSVNGFINVSSDVWVGPGVSSASNWYISLDTDKIIIWHADSSVKSKSYRIIVIYKE